MITLTELENRLNKTFESGEAMVIENTIIPAITKFIENYTGRIFTELNSGSYWYYGTGKRELEIDEFTTITKVEAYDSDDLVEEITNYELLPFNESYKNRIRNLNGLFSSYKYKITGKKGYSITPPLDLKLIALELVSELQNTKGGLKRESIEQYSYEIGSIINDNPVIRETLGHYKKALI